MFWILCFTRIPLNLNQFFCRENGDSKQAENHELYTCHVRQYSLQILNYYHTQKKQHLKYNNWIVDIPDWPIISEINPFC